MSYPVFASGDVLNASDMNGVGLWLVKSQTIGTGVSSVTVTGAFSADYNRYKITIDGYVGSTTGTLNFQLGSTATGYYGVYNYQIYTGISTVAYQANTTSSFLGGLGTLAGEQSITCEIAAPQKATKTTWTAQAYGNGFYVNLGYQLADSTQYTGFTLLPSAGTITGGTIRIYGYRD